MAMRNMLKNIKGKKRRLGRFILNTLSYPITNENGTTDRTWNEVMIWLVLAYVVFSLMNLVGSLSFNLISVAIIYIIYIQTFASIAIKQNQFTRYNQKDVYKNDIYTTYHEKMNKIDYTLAKVFVGIAIGGFLLLLARETFWSWILIGAPPLVITLCKEILESIKRMYTY